MKRIDGSAPGERRAVELLKLCAKGIRALQSMQK